MAKHLRSQVKTSVVDVDGAERERGIEEYENFSATGKVIEQTFILPSGTSALTQAGPSFRPSTIQWKSDEPINFDLYLRTSPGDPNGFLINGTKCRLMNLPCVCKPGTYPGIFARAYSKVGLISLDDFEAPELSGLNTNGECLEYVVRRVSSTLDCQIDITFGG